MGFHGSGFKPKPMSAHGTLPDVSRCKDHYDDCHSRGQAELYAQVARQAVASVVALHSHE